MQYVLICVLLCFSVCTHGLLHYMYHITCNMYAMPKRHANVVFVVVVVVVAVVAWQQTSVRARTLSSSSTRV